MRIKQGNACTGDNDQGLAVVKGSITVYSIINFGSSQEAVTTPHPHGGRALMCRQAWPRMTFTSHTLQKDALLELAQECRGSQKPLCFLEQQCPFWRQRKSMTFGLYLEGARVSNPQATTAEEKTLDKAGEQGGD